MAKKELGRSVGTISIEELLTKLMRIGLVVRATLWSASRLPERQLRYDIRGSRRQGIVPDDADTAQFGGGIINLA